MKRFAIFALVLLVIPAFAQDHDWNNQNLTRMLNNSLAEHWIFYPSTVLTPEPDSTYFVGINATDTLYSAIYANANWMTLNLYVPDVASLRDSISIKVNFYTGATNTRAAMILNKTLDFDWGPVENHAVIRTNNATLDTLGYWHCDVGRTPYKADPFCMLEVIGLTGCPTVNDSLNLQIRAVAKVGRSE